MSDANLSSSFILWQEEVHAYYSTLSPVPAPSRNPLTREDQKQRFVVHAFNHIQDPVQRATCKLVTTHFLATNAWLAQIQTGEEGDLIRLVIQYGKKHICSYCRGEHAKGHTALACIYKHLDYQPFFCGQNGQMCQQAQAQGLFAGCGARYVTQASLNRHLR